MRQIGLAVIPHNDTRIPQINLLFSLQAASLTGVSVRGGEYLLAGTILPPGRQVNCLRKEPPEPRSLVCAKEAGYTFGLGGVRR